MSLIRDALTLLEGIRDDGHDSIIVGVSGGKDSLTTLDLCTQVFPVVHGFFMHMVPGLECEERNLRIAERRYGVTLHRLPHPGLAAALRFGHLRDGSPSLSSGIDRNLSFVDVERIVRARTGSTWIAAGHRIIDSLHRRGMITKHRGRWEKFRRCYPIWDWKPKDVFAYMRAKKIPIPQMFGSSVTQTSGFDPGNPACLLFLKKHFPQDYAKVVEWFPHAESVLMRDEMRAKYEIEYNA